MFDTFLLPLGGGGVGAPEFFVVGVLRFKFVFGFKSFKIYILLCVKFITII